MSSDVSIEFRSSYLRANLPEGYEITPENVENLWSAIGEACKKYECNRVLVEGKIASRKMTSMDAYNSGKQAGGVAPLRLACVFYDYLPDETTNFFKMVASNRGVLVEFFTNRIEALRWLGINFEQ